MSPIAPHILQQVTTRVKVWVALDKAEVLAFAVKSYEYIRSFLRTLPGCFQISDSPLA